MNSEPIRIFLVENHDGVREALRRIITAQSDMTIVGEASNGNAAIEFFELIDPDITLIDLNMPEVNGIKAIRTIKQLHPGAQFIAMSAFDFEEEIDESYEAGATAFLTKDTTRDIMLNVIRSVHSGSYKREITVKKAWPNDDVAAKEKSKSL